jgi:Ser/Thr protein kinase RdoA (MazF antagonist)
MPGLNLRKCLLDRRLAVPEPKTIMALLDWIPAPPDGGTARSQAAAALELAPLLRALAPDCESLIDMLVEELLETRTATPVAPVHGDLHEAQITVLNGRVAGLLDIDTAGLGERIDDWATLLGHLAVLREEAPPATRHRIQSYAARLMAVADQDVAEPTRLRKRVAAVIFGLASGPFRVQSSAWLDRTRSRLRLAEAWLQNAHRHMKDESVLSRA